MAFFKSLVKQHGTQFFEPIGKALQAAGIRKPNPLNPAHAWALRGALVPYGRWMLHERLRRRGRPELPTLSGGLREHAEYAADFLQRSPREISGAMRKHQLALADRQCRMSELSSRIQAAVVMLCTSLYAAGQDALVRDAAELVCGDLRRQLEGRRPSDRSFRRANKLGEAIAEGTFSPLAGVEAQDILMRYDQG